MGAITASGYYYAIFVADIILIIDIKTLALDVHVALTHVVVPVSVNAFDAQLNSTMHQLRLRLRVRSTR
jgi:hypothetical protein